MPVLNFFIKHCLESKDVDYILFVFCLLFVVLQFNTESDPPYWRGSIWINMNYLAVRALHHYSNTGGPYRQLAAQLYTDLR